MRFDGLSSAQFRTKYETDCLRALFREFAEAAKATAQRQRDATPAVVAPIATNAAVQSAANVQYIKREREEAEFHELVDKGAKRIALVGQPGMGKTWLARAVTEGAPLVRVTSGTINTLDLASAYEMCGLDSRELGGLNPNVALVRLIAGKQAPRFVVLDNLESTDELRQLLPTNETTSIVVATCRIKGAVLPSTCQLVQVRRMRNSEAIRMVERRIPQLTEEGADDLALRFAGGYPLVIAYVCDLFIQQDLSIQEFCHSLSSDAEAVAQGVHTDEGIKLQVVLRRMIQLVEDRNHLAYELLVHIILGPLVNRLEELSGYAEIALGIKSPVLRCAQALGLLGDFSLIRIESDGITAAHPVTREVLQEELRPELFYLYKNLEKLLNNYQTRVNEYLREYPQPTRLRELRERVPDDARIKMARAMEYLRMVAYSIISAVNNDPAVAQQDSDLVDKAREILKDDEDHYSAFLDAHLLGWQLGGDIGDMTYVE